MPKVIWPDIAKTMRFAWDTTGAFVDMTVFFTSGLGREYLTLLNSAVAQFLLAFLTYSLRGGYLRLKRQYMDQFPVPMLEPVIREALVEAGDNPRDQIGDQLAVAAYHLNQDERRLLHDWRISLELLQEADTETEDEVQDDA